MLILYFSLFWYNKSHQENLVQKLSACQETPDISAWSEAWVELQGCAWPKLRPLMDVFGHFEVRVFLESVECFGVVILMEGVGSW